MGGGAGEGPGSREAEFLNEIDCQFPYSDPERARAIAGDGLSISANAAFAVVYEICYVPKGVAADPVARHDVLATIERGISHPLKGLVLQLARDLVDGKTLPRADQIALMRRIEPFRNQYAALQIVLGAGETDEADEFDDEPNRVYDEILASWHAKRH